MPSTSPTSACRPSPPTSRSSFPWPRTWRRSWRCSGRPGGGGRAGPVIPRAGAGLGHDVARPQLGAALGAGEVAGQLAAAVAVADDARRTGLGGVVAVAPVHEGDGDRPQVDALLGQAV